MQALQTKSTPSTQRHRLAGNIGKAGWIVKLVKNNQKACGYIDIRSISNQLGIAIDTEYFESSTNVGVLYKNDANNRVIRLADRLTFQEQNGIIAWMIAEYLINDRTLDISRPIICSVFNLREFRANRYSRTMLLATRLVMTEKTIEGLSRLQSIQYQQNMSHWLTSEFVNAAIKGHSVAFLLNNDYI